MSKDIPDRMFAKDVADKATELADEFLAKAMSVNKMTTDTCLLASIAFSVQAINTKLRMLKR